MPVISLAILGDIDRPNWRPEKYAWNVPCTRVEMNFGVAKLFDYNERWAELEASENPFGLLTLAHLRAKQTRGGDAVEERYRWKRYLLELLAKKGWPTEDVCKFLAFIDRVMNLPEDVNEALKAEIGENKEKTMQEFMSTWEEAAVKKGREEGREEGRLGQMRMLQRHLTLHFGDLPAWTVERLERATVDQLENWDDRLFDATTREAVFDDE